MGKNESVSLSYWWRGRVGEGVTSSSRCYEVAKDEGKVMVRAHHLHHGEVDKGALLSLSCRNAAKVGAWGRDEREDASVVVVVVVVEGCQWMLA